VKRSDFAIASLILGLISFIQLLGIERAVAAIIFGIIALRQISKEPELRGRWLAVTGIILGVLYLSLLVGFWPQIMQILRRVTG
jgi:uncharacterized membrane protein YhaH (DUF805 family)